MEGSGWLAKLKGKVGEKGEELTKGIVPVREFLFPAGRPYIITYHTCRLNWSEKLGFWAS